MIIPSSTNMINLKSQETLEGFTPPDDKKTSTESQLPEPVSDHLFLNNIRPEQAREFLLNHINRKLDIASSTATKNIADYSENVSSVNETSNQIVASINRALNNHNLRTQDATARIDEVISNVNSGFTETREILKNLNILRREFVTEFHDIQRNVNNFLDTKYATSNFKTADQVD